MACQRFPHLGWSLHRQFSVAYYVKCVAALQQKLYQTRNEFREIVEDTHD